MTGIRKKAQPRENARTLLARANTGRPPDTSWLQKRESRRNPGSGFQPRVELPGLRTRATAITATTAETIPSCHSQAAF